MDREKIFDLVLLCYIKRKKWSEYVKLMEKELGRKIDENDPILTCYAKKDKNGYVSLNNRGQVLYKIIKYKKRKDFQQLFEPISSNTHISKEKNSNTHISEEKNSNTHISEEKNTYKKSPIASFVERLRLLTPKEMYNELERLGYRGQEKARKSVCLAAYRHIKRIKSIYVDNIDRNKLLPKRNYLLVGPTGVGKTYIIELLFGEILQLPFVMVDATNYTEVGYVGEDVVNMVTRLVHAAKDEKLAEIGVIAIDEFDKIASRRSTVYFAGEGTTKDVSGYGVQRELLKLLEGGKVRAQLDYGFSRWGPATFVDTRDIMFFGIGAFSGIKELSQEKPIGFNVEVKSEPKSGIAYKLTEEEIEDLGKFQKYGFIPELLARFHKIIFFDPLDENTLKEILNIKLDLLQKEFLMEGYKLILTDEVIDFIVKKAIKRETGARALETIITNKLEDLAFNLFGEHREGEIILQIKNNDIECITKFYA